MASRSGTWQARQYRQQGTHIVAAQAAQVDTDAIARRNVQPHFLRLGFPQQRRRDHRDKRRRFTQRRRQSANPFLAMQSDPVVQLVRVDAVGQRHLGYRNRAAFAKLDQFALGTFIVRAVPQAPRRLPTVAPTLRLSPFRAHSLSRGHKLLHFQLRRLDAVKRAYGQAARRRSRPHGFHRNQSRAGEILLPGSSRQIRSIKTSSRRINKVAAVQQVSVPERKIMTPDQIGRVPLDRVWLVLPARFGVPSAETLYRLLGVAWC